MKTPKKKKRATFKISQASIPVYRRIITKGGRRKVALVHREPWVNTVTGVPRASKGMLIFKYKIEMVE